MRNYIGKRNYRSEPEAISRLSNYGVAKVLKINETNIIEEFVRFNVRKLGPKKLGALLNKIHSETNTLGQSLVHGDFGEHNTTILHSEPKCFDYEYAHFGDIYADLGKVILRDCNNWEGFTDFFSCYAGEIPHAKELKRGLIYFCDWQNSLRIEKQLPYSEVPLHRKNRLRKVKSKSLMEILDAFKSEVRLQ